MREKAISATWMSLCVIIAVLIGLPAVSLPVRALDTHDKLWTNKALYAMDRGRWQTTGKYARQIKDSLARKFLAWNVLSRTNRVARFELITDFLRQNPQWPRQQQLRKRAEETLGLHIPAQQVLAYFRKNRPVSATGNSRLAGALLDVGRLDEARRLVRKTWINGNFPKAEEVDFYKNFRHLLTSGDHIKRMDRLLWDGQYWPARRMLPRVPKDWRALAEARFSLRRQTGNVDRLISRVPDVLKNDPGLLYERLRWRRQKGKDDAIDILKSPPPELERPELWWRERAVIVRDSLAKGHITEAYRLVSDHRLAGGAAYADAEWMAGWIALRFLGDPETARRHFEKMYVAVRYPISRARGAYWIGRSLEAAKQGEKATQWYGKAAAYPTTYYGQLATARFRPDQSLIFADDPVVGRQQRQSFDSHELVRVVRMLGQLGQQDRIRPFIGRLYQLSTEPAWRKMTAALAKSEKRPDLAVWVAKRSSRDGREIMSAAYPALDPPVITSVSKSSRPEPPFVLALIRQESAFRIDAVSPARAKGLMQLMPATARTVAKRVNIQYSSSRLTRDPTYNMTLGQYYLSGVLDRFDRSYVLALSAYNAGPSRVNQWIRAFGDPRDKDVDAIDWVEMIPFEETRNYVQRVLENLQVYRTRMAETEVALRLEDDLHQ